MPPAWLNFRGWAYPEGMRDLRIDLLRGAAVVAMIVDHIGGDASWLYPLTGGNRFYVSAAEAFIFISGLVSGLVYGRAAAREGLGPAVMKILRRAGLLYAFSVVLTMVLPWLGLNLGLAWDNPLRDSSLADFAVSVLTLHRTYYLVDVLLLYTLLFVCAGLALTLISQGRTRLLLAGSWSIWLLWQCWPQFADVPWNITGQDVFHFPAWQALFFTAMALGAHRQAIGRRLARIPHLAYLVLSGALLAGSIAVYKRELDILSHIFPGVSPETTAGVLFAKADLRIGRLVVFAIVAIFAFSSITVFWTPIREGLGWLLVSLGQHSLAAYSLHLLVVPLMLRLGDVAFGSGSHPAAVNTVLQLTGVAAVWLAVDNWVRLLAAWRQWRQEHAAMRQVPNSPVVAVPLTVPVTAAVSCNTELARAS